MAKRRDASGDLQRLSDIRQQLDLYESQRYKHRQIIDGEAGRRADIGVEIKKRQDAIAVMRRELDELPVRVHHSRSVVSRLDDQIAALKARNNRIKLKQRKREQLARVRQQIAELSRSDE